MDPNLEKRVRSVYSSTVGCRLPTYSRSLRSVFFGAAWAVASRSVDGPGSSSWLGKERKGVVVVVVGGGVEAIGEQVTKQAPGISFELSHDRLCFLLCPSSHSPRGCCGCHINLHSFVRQACLPFFSVFLCYCVHRDKGNTMYN
jgi:hypothetical protein